MRVELFISMNILALSDLHLEASNFTTPIPHADVVILAGDIGVGLQGLKWAKQIDAQVLYVMGNHEFEGYEYNHMLDQAREFAHTTDNIKLLQQDEIIIDDTRFLGCTLWTDFELFGISMKEHAKRAALYGMPEYASIFMKHKLLHVNDTLDLHKSDYNWLKLKLRTPFSGDTIVITHHAPHPNSVIEHYRHNLLSAAFASDLTDLLGRNKTWVHGHTHAGLDYCIDDTRIVCNPRGRNKTVNYSIREFDLYKFIDFTWDDYTSKP